MISMREPDLNKRENSYDMLNAKFMLYAALPIIGEKRMNEIERIVSEEYAVAEKNVSNKMLSPTELMASDALAVVRDIKKALFTYDLAVFYEDVKKLEMGEE